MSSQNSMQPLSTRWRIQVSGQDLPELGQEIPASDQQSAQALGAFQKSEIEKWWPLIKADDIKPE